MQPKKQKNTNLKHQFLPKLGAGGGQIFQKRPNFIDLGALVCDSYPSIDIPKIVKIDQQTQAQVCMYVYQPQDHNIVRWLFDQLLKNRLVNVLKF